MGLCGLRAERQCYRKRGGTMRSCGGLEDRLQEERWHYEVVVWVGGQATGREVAL